MKEIFENMKNLADEFITDAEEFVNKQKKHDNMKKHVKVTALTDKGTSIVSGWFADVNKGEEYAAAMMQRGYVCVKQYREV